MLPNRLSLSIKRFAPQRRPTAPSPTGLAWVMAWVAGSGRYCRRSKRIAGSIEEAEVPRIRSMSELVVWLTLAGWASAGCLAPPTQVLVFVSTDLPEQLPMTLRACVQREGAGPACRQWTRDGSRGIALPASFTVVPREGGPRDELVTLVVEASATEPSGTVLALRRTARFRFAPQNPQELRVFLSAACAASASDCTTVAPSACTVSVRCAELGQTCGDEGTCVAVEVPLRPSPRIPFEPDGATAMDARRDGAIDASDARTDSAIDAIDAIDVTVDGDGGPDASVADVPSDVRCGVTGTPCCSGSACSSGSECFGGTCRACGQPTQSCCPGSTCASIAECSAGTCRACGGIDERCCSGTTCRAGADCRAGTCRACGQPTQSCCAGNTCASIAECSAGTCRACGGVSERCCNGTDCRAGGYCSAGTCRACGASGQPCCPSSTCNAGLRCSAGTCRV